MTAGDQVITRAVIPVGAPLNAILDEAGGRTGFILMTTAGGP